MHSSPTMVVGHAWKSVCDGIQSASKKQCLYSCMRGCYNNKCPFLDSDTQIPPLFDKEMVKYHNKIRQLNASMKSGG